jgi:TRAP-type uncharacterized transport system fused permease subunit
VRFGAVKYVLPFFFVYNPALVAQHTGWLHITLVSAGALLGVILLSYALQGHLPGVGAVGSSAGGWLVRGLLVVAGVLVAAPELISTVVGLALASLTYGVLLAAPAARRALVAP